MTARIPERDKKIGLSYADTNEGIELPVLDVTHPEFELRLTPAEIDALREDFYREEERRAGMPYIIRRMLLQFYARKSVLLRGLRGASTGFLSGMNTYLLKLGPRNLGAGYASGIDRKVAAAFPVILLRLRTQNTALLLAQGLKGLLAERPGAPLHLLNIAGGHATDSMNTLIILRRDAPQLIEGRRVHIQVLDLESDAPDFGRRALRALLEEGAPLAGLDVTFDHVPFNWSRPEALRTELEALGPAIVALSTEGGLFEYGSDGEIVANLGVLRDVAPPGTFIVGSVTRDDARDRPFITANRIPIIPRGLPVFTALVRQAGWAVEASVEQPFSDVVRLVRSA